MNYDEYKSEIAAKGFNNVVTGRISSKKAEDTTKFFGNTTKTAKFTNNQTKAHKKGQEATNDAELARRNALYAKKGVYTGPTFYPKPTVSTSNPNLAFKRKKIKQCVIDPLQQRSKDEFIVPPRYRKMYKDMVAKGNSVHYTIVCIKNRIKLENQEVKQFDPTTQAWDPEDEDVTPTADPLSEDDSLWDIDEMGWQNEDPPSS